MANTAGLINKPEGVQEGEYVQLADGKYYHKDVAKEISIERAITRQQYYEGEIGAISDCMGSSPEKKMNPKYVRAQKDCKTPMECLITSVLASEARVLAHGADKYGVRNWRLDEILASTYEGAMMRHLIAWMQGEDTDPDSGEPHLSHLRACAGVVMDADMHGKMVDDRGRMESKGE